MEKRESFRARFKRKYLDYGLLLVFILFILFFLLFIGGRFTGFAVYETYNQAGFDEGSYNNTEYNGSAVILSEGNISGTYVSKIFDAGNDEGANWNNLSYFSTNPIENYLYGVDGGGDIYRSTDLGDTWSLFKEDYGRTTATTNMLSNSDYLFITSSNGNEVWRSLDYGKTWAVINDTFSSATPLEGKSDFSDNLYLLTGPGAVFKSSDNGQTWIEQGDINGGATNDPKGLAINSSDALFAVDGTGAVYVSSNEGITWTEQTSSYGGGSATDDLVADSNGHLYILLDKEVYKSENLGVDWTLINNSFTSYPNNGVVMIVDENDYLFVVDAIGRIFVSTNSGITWIEKGDMNGGSTNDPKGLTTFSLSTDLSFEVRNCSSSDCSDGNWQSVDLDNLNLQSRYFQYRVIFSGMSSISPQLYNVSLNYDLINTAPEVYLFEPQNTLYTENESIALNYTVIDNDNNLDACWYNLDNGENITLINCENTAFNVSEGNHVLTIYANDSLGLMSSDFVEFNVDASGISISILEPIGTQTSRIGIPLNYTIIGNNVSCEYNVKTSVGGEIIGNTSLENCSESSFDVSTDGDYVLNLYANNSLGSSAFEFSSFSVDTSSTVIINSGGGGGGGSSTTIISGLTELDLGNLSNLVVYSGDSKKLYLRAKNIGTSILNDCYVVEEGNSNFWILSNERKNLASGEIYKFVFDLVVSEEVEVGKHNLDITLNCQELNKSTDLIIEIIEKKLNFEILDVERITEGEVQVNYLLEELSNINQKVQLQFILFDFENEKIAEIKEIKDISANSIGEFEITIPIESSLEGEMRLLVNLNSETYSTFVSEDLILGAPISGLSVFGNSGEIDTLASGFIIILFLVGAFFIVRKILKHKKKLKKRKKLKNRKKKFDFKPFS